MNTTLRTVDRRRPINWRDPLNRNLVAWWLALPGWGGCPLFRDLTGQHNATLTGFASGFGWRGRTTQPSESNEIETDGTGSLTLKASDSTAFGSADFTAGCWFRIDTAGTTFSMLLNRWAGGSATGQFSAYVNTGRTISVDIPFVVGNVVVVASPLPVGVAYRRTRATQLRQTVVTTEKPGRIPPLVPGAQDHRPLDARDFAG